MELQAINQPRFDLISSTSMLELSKDLAKLIKDKGLSSNIQGKQFVNVEGWQFAGASLGLMPIITSTQDLSKDDEVKYMATCEVRNINTGQLVATGIAICSNKEHTKKRFDEYAILSMAQTRAIGKAYRNLLAWLMKAAGFEATPAEEMDFVDAKADTRATDDKKSSFTQPKKEEKVVEVDAEEDYFFDRVAVIKQIASVTKQKELVDVYYQHKQYIDGDEALLMLLKSKKEQL